MPFSTAAHASTTNGPTRTSWPFATASNGAPAGALCNLSFWSSNGTSQDTFAWTNSYDGYVDYSCDIVTAGGHPMLDPAPLTDTAHSPPYCDWPSGSSYQETPVMYVPVVTAGNDTWPIGIAQDCTVTDNGQSAGLDPHSGTRTLMDNSFRGTTSQWWEIQGEVVYMHGCQSGGSASNAVCGGGHHGSGTVPANPSAATMCNTTPGSAHFNATGDVSTGTVNLLCNVVSSTGVTPAPPGIRPDGTTPPPANTFCDVGTFSGTIGGVTLASTGEVFHVTSGDVVHWSIQVIFNGGGTPATPQLNIESSAGLTNGGYFIEQALAGSGSSPYTATYDWTAPSTGDFRAAAWCNLNGIPQNQRDYNAAGTGYHGEPGTGPFDNCGSASVGCAGTTQYGGTAVESGGACFNGIWTTLHFLGIDFPWMSVSELPADVVCFLAVEVTGTPAQWDAEWHNVQASYNASPLAQLVTVVALPFNAAQAFASAATGGSCAGPAISYPMISDVHMGTTDVAIHPMDACSGGVATAAGIIRVALTVSLWIGTFWLSFRLIAATLGFTPGVVTSDGPTGEGFSFSESSGNSPQQGGSFS